MWNNIFGICVVQAKDKITNHFLLTTDDCINQHLFDFDLVQRPDFDLNKFTSDALVPLKSDPFGLDAYNIVIPCSHNGMYLGLKVSQKVPIWVPLFRKSQGTFCGVMRDLDFKANSDHHTYVYPGATSRTA